MLSLRSLMSLPGSDGRVELTEGEKRSMAKSKIIEEDLVHIAEQLQPYYAKLSGKTILIAGGAGFLGRYLVSSLVYLNEHGLLPQKCRIIVVDNFISGLRGWLPTDDPHITLLQRDIKEPLRIDGDVHYIVHAASIASPLFYNRLRIETIDAGIYGTRSLLDLARDKNVDSFLFMSSSEVYGDPDPKHIPTSEGYFGNVSCTGPRACYDEPKRMGETLCVTYADVYRLPIKIVRPFNIFGPGIRLDDGRVMPNFVLSAIAGKRIPVHGDGRKTRTFCYISNATVGFFQILLSDHNREIYNIGDDDPEIQMRHLASLIHGLVMNETSSVDLVVGPSEVYTESNPERRRPDLSKIRTQLAYDPKVDFVTGLKRFIAWMREEMAAQYNSARIETACRVCGGEDLRTFLSLGRSPLANRLLKQEQLEEPVESYPLEVAYCPACHNCQLTCTVEPEAMFTEYPYVTSTTATFRKHFGEMATHVTAKLNLPPHSLVVDVGSNDGLLLSNFQNLGMRVVGVEPASNIVDMARTNGVDTIHGYFDEDIARDIIKLKGHATVVTANNVFAHTAHVDRFVSSVLHLLDRDGVFVVETQYLLETLRQMTFDNVYHEHVSYFSMLSLQRLFEKRGMQVFDAEHVDTHGGSLRVFVQRAGGPFPVQPSVEEFIKNERRAGLDRLKTFEDFGRKVHAVRDKIRQYVQDVKGRKERLVGYGAPAKATTLLNFCGIDDKDLEYLVDDNPLKQGLYVPGVNVPIRSRARLDEAPPQNVLILAWNFADEIIGNNDRLRGAGTRFIVPLPEPRVVD
jgi:nucleoside-diphosphate-sugar epimerase/SAM-dependent methyltransferase